MASACCCLSPAMASAGHYQRDRPVDLGSVCSWPSRAFPGAPGRFGNRFRRRGRGTTAADLRFSRWHFCCFTTAAAACCTRAPWPCWMRESTRALGAAGGGPSRPRQPLALEGLAETGDFYAVEVNLDGDFDPSRADDRPQARTRPRHRGGQRRATTFQQFLRFSSSLSGGSRRQRNRRTAGWSKRSTCGSARRQTRLSWPAPC